MVVLRGLEQVAPLLRNQSGQLCLESARANTSPAGVRACPGAAASLSFLGGPEMLPCARNPGVFAEVVRGAAPGRAVLLIPPHQPWLGLLLGHLDFY